MMARYKTTCRAEFDHGFTEFKKRLSTFEIWTGTLDSKVGLARLGFSYTGSKDKVQCQYCNGKLYWEEGRDPYIEHKRRFPGCAFVLHVDVDNRNPVNPAFEDLASRLVSFPDSPFIRTPNELSTAGFYYLGPGKYACFHCGIRVSNWQEEDDPFYVHKVFSPACSFIRNLTDFQKLGISVPDGLGDEEKKSLQAISEEGMVNDPMKRLLIDSINLDSDLFQKLSALYDKNTIVREMTAMIQRRGRNFTSSDEFISCFTTRQNLRSSQRAMSATMVDELKAENIRLRDERTCNMCMDMKATVVFLPCGHFVTCDPCAQNIRDCPICKTVIQGKVPVKMS